MADVAVITGGSTGIGLETARIIGKEIPVFIAGRSEEKLKVAKADLEASGVDVEIYPCDVRDKASLEKLAELAASKGDIKAVVHSSGLSPDNAGTKDILTTNVLGTVYVSRIFAPVMAKKSCIVNIASMAGHLMPENQMPMDIIPLSLSNPEECVQKLEELINNYPEERQSGAAYSIAKYQNIWFSKECALEYAPDIRVISVSPGSFNTPMGRAGGERTAAYAKGGPIGRLGEPEEIARLVAFLASDDASYITAVDYLCDGGSVAAAKKKAAAAAG